MHELGIMTGVIHSVEEVAKQNNAREVLLIKMSIGEMTEAMEDALQFAFEVASIDTLCEGAKLEVNIIAPKSRCDECGLEFEHNRFIRTCPECDSLATTLLSGREMQIDSIEIDN